MTSREADAPILREVKLECARLQRRIRSCRKQAITLIDPPGGAGWGRWIIFSNRPPSSRPSWIPKSLGWAYGHTLGEMPRPPLGFNMALSARRVTAPEQLSSNSTPNQRVATTPRHSPAPIQLSIFLARAARQRNVNDHSTPTQPVTMSRANVTQLQLSATPIPLQPNICFWPERVNVSSNFTPHQHNS
jgi:hypothetical protein